VARGFWDIPAAFSVVGEFARVGRQGPRPRRPGQSGRPRHPPKKPKPCSKRSAFAVIFFMWWNPVFARGFWQKRVVGRGFLVVNLWWIAGKSWWVDGQDSARKHALFPDLFLGIPILGIRFRRPAPRSARSPALSISSGMLLVRKSSAVDSPRAADRPRWLVSRTTKTYEPYPKLRTRLTSPHDQTPLCSCMRRCKKPFSSVHTFAGL
jgi:hypothetical protein